MIRYDDKHVSVRISDAALNQAYGTSEIMRYLRGTELLHGVLAWASAIGLGLLIAYSAVSGN